MRTFLSLIFIALVLVLTKTSHAEIHVSSYPQLIIGKWDIRTYGHSFSSDGTCSIFNPDNNEVLETGTWSMRGGKLTMNWPSRQKQTVGIKFLNKDLFEWQSSPGRVWEATRLGSTP
jgi:hypothetical protein